jgi:DNA invertase Pin-like site-specific DNA recombinase
MPHLVGYARVSTADQNPDLQHDALKAAGCYRIFVDTASGTLDDRQELAKVLEPSRAPFRPNLPAGWPHAIAPADR